jgi:hypothetical protein
MLNYLSILEVEQFGSERGTNSTFTILVLAVGELARQL